MPAFKISLVFLIWALATHPIVAQHRVVCFVPVPSIYPLPFASGPARRLDSLRAVGHWQDLVLKLRRQGFVTASVDSVQWRPDTVKVYVYQGPRFRWADLRPGNVPESVLSEIGFRERLFQGRRFSAATVTVLQEKILAHADDRGHPFASIRLDSLRILEESLSASLDFQPGIRIVFDTLHFVGSARLRRRFLERWLRLSPGQPYSQRRLDQAWRLLQQQPFLKIDKPYFVSFKNDRAYVTIHADGGQASEADGIVGFQPNEQEEGRLLLTGELNLRLRNLFASAGSFFFSWQQIKKASPRLQMSYAQPAFLNTPLEINASLQLLREDSSRSVQNGFLTLSQQLALHYPLGSYHTVGIGVERRTSRLGDSTRQAAATDDRIPQQANANWLAYKVFHLFSRLDNSQYPKRGWWWQTSMAIGNKQVLPSPGTDWKQAGIQTQGMQFSYQTRLRRYLPLGKRSTLLLETGLGQIFGPALFQNDLFRLGGLSSLRGFNENFFFTSDYVTATAEYRFFWEKTSYLFVFYDQGFLQTRILRNRFSDTPTGLGAGLSFATRAGIFTFAYGLGRSQDRALGLNLSKVHFGLVSRF